MSMVREPHHDKTESLRQWRTKTESLTMTKTKSLRLLPIKTETLIGNVTLRL
jgi:hypothetical protein